MSTHTGIQWTSSTWNPIRGCSRVSEGCRHCYAEAVAARFSGPGQPYEGLARRRANGEPQWTGEVRVIENHLLDPIRWRRPRRIFVNSMSDLFHEQLVVDDIAHIFAVMALAPRHTFQVLTKRARGMQETLSHPDWLDILNAHVQEIAFELSDSTHRRTDDLRATAREVDGPLPNVWLGVSAENQQTANERVPLLSETPAAVRFISAEPLLGPIDFDECGSRGEEDGDPFAFSALAGADGVEPPIPGIDWVIVGGESGPHARPCNVEWIRGIVAQCGFAGTAVFVKQLGSQPGFTLEDEERRGNMAPSFHHYDAQSRLYIKKVGDSHGGRVEEFPEELRVREFPVAAPEPAR